MEKTTNFIKFLSENVWSSTTFLVASVTLGLGFWQNSLLDRQISIGQKQVAVSQEQIAINLKQAETSERNLFNDRLSRAIEALGATDSLAVRNAGLRLIDSLIKDTHADLDNRALLLDILHGYIRDRAMLPESDDDGNLPDALPRKERTDIELAIEILFRNVPRDSRKYPNKLDLLDLRKLNLSGLDLRELNLASFDLEGAYLLEANLDGVNLFQANLQGADLDHANLRGAVLSLANLEGANLWGANLQGAVLSFANLQNAYLFKANLQGTNLFNSNLQGANLLEANLQGANISAADIDEVKNLTQDMLDTSIYSQNKPPENLPADLKLSSDRAYEIVRDARGNIRFRERFVESGEWIDIVTPW